MFFLISFKIKSNSNLISKNKTVFIVLPFELKHLVKCRGLPIEIEFFENMFNPRKYKRTDLNTS